MDKQVHVHVGDTQAAKNDGPTEASDSPDRITSVFTNEGDYRARLTV